MIKFMNLALGFLVGNQEEGDSVESCSGGLLGKEINGKKVFTYNIPILGFSICSFVSEFQIVVDAIDQLVNECTDCTDSDSPKSTFTLLETKLMVLLQNTVGGTPSVVFTPASEDTRSSLELDISLEWSLPDALELNIDLAGILESMDLDDDVKNFIKGFVNVEGGNIELMGTVSFSLGLGLEYNKVVSFAVYYLSFFFFFYYFVTLTTQSNHGMSLRQTETIVPYLKGTTGFSVIFLADANAIFQALIGPLSATVELKATIDYYGDPLSFSIGLDPSINYYISDSNDISRSGFQRKQNISDLRDEVVVALAGRVEAEINAELLQGLGSAFLKIQISDLNTLFQKRPSGVALYYRVSSVSIPSIIDILLLDPYSIVTTVDKLFKSVNDMTLGRNGIVSKRIL